MALPIEYTSILNDLNRDVLRARPNDTLQFCSDWFQARLSDQRKASSSARQGPASSSLAPDVTMAAPPPSSFPGTAASSSGLFSGSSNPFGSTASANPVPTLAPDHDEEDEEAFVAPPTFNMGRRTSVSAESLVPGSSAAKEIENATKTVIPKSDSQMTRIRRATEGNLLFRHLEEDQFNDVLLAMKEVKVEPNVAVIEQGAQGDYFYVVESGTLDVYVRPSVDNRSSIGSTLTDDGPGTETTSSLGDKKISYGPSASFGELALLYAQPRAATVLSTSACILWALDRITFRSILMETNNRRREMYESFIKEVPLFEHLSASERAKISDALELKTFEVGQEVVKQGERGTEFYVIVDGEAEVRKRTVEREEEVIGRLGKGDYFGELALLNKAPRAATIAAATPRAGGSDSRLRVAALSESAFTRLLGPLSEIMNRHAEEAYGSASSILSLSTATHNGGGPTSTSTPSTGSAATTGGFGANNFGEIAPHSVAPQGGAGDQAGGGFWVGGMGNSPFGATAASPRA